VANSKNPSLLQKLNAIKRSCVSGLMREVNKSVMLSRGLFFIMAFIGKRMYPILFREMEWLGLRLGPSWKWPIICFIFKV